MKPGQAEALATLLRTQQVAALGTLHRGAPYVSMTPYALLPRGRFVLHVSRLATHTKDMLEQPAVSLLVMAPPAPGAAPQALARATILGDAAPCPDDDARHADARAAYLARFPASEPMFGFGDFSLFVVTPRAVRHVGGFAQADSLGAEAFARLMDDAR